MTDRADVPAALAEQLDYYRARAAEYDEWWLRLGRYDRGDGNAAWFGEIETLVSELDRFQPAGSVLELAGGTGLWTEKLLRYARRLTVVDGSTEMLELNAARLGRPQPERVRYVRADVFDWKPAEAYDTVFFGFWLSHVPSARFDAFWALVRRCLAPGGRVFFVDSRRLSASGAAGQGLPDPDDRMERRLNDGRTFNVYKIYHAPADLERRLHAMGWRAKVDQTTEYFIYGRCAS